MKFIFSDFIEKNTTWKKWVSFFTLFILFNIYFSFYTNPKFEKISGGLGTPDATQGYSVEQVEKLLSTLPKEGIQFYLYYFFPPDLVFPIIYTIFFTLTLSLLFSKILSPKNYLRYFLLLPSAMAFADYLENFGIIFMISLLPDFYPKIGLIISIFSVIKWRLGAIISIGIAISVIVYLFKSINERIRNTKT
ncbi:MAG: hypothetical protein GY795_30950 [Desulfobacterales bacterium]|nr:hypothetical protein [Desulfobacterales bacterium]